MTFPTSPSNGTTHSIGDTTFVYKSATKQWKGTVTGTSSSGGGSSGSTAAAPTTISSTAPTSPTDGALWYDLSVGKLFVSISSVWVDISPR